MLTEDMIRDAARVYVKLAAKGRSEKAKPAHIDDAAGLWATYEPLRAALESVAAAVATAERKRIALAIDAECRRQSDGSPWGDGMNTAADIARANPEGGAL